MKIERLGKFGGNVEFGSFEGLAQAFGEGKLHPADLKNGTAAALNRLLEPVRKHFAKGKPRKLREEVRKLDVTR